MKKHSMALSCIFHIKFVAKCIDRIQNLKKFRISKIIQLLNSSNMQKNRLRKILRIMYLPYENRPQLH